MIKNCIFSIYPHGYISNKTDAPVPASKPNGTWSIEEAYKYITSDEAKDATLALRSIEGKNERRRFKALNFTTATFGGVFSYRNAQSLAIKSDLMVLDVDDLKDEEEARHIQQVFINDQRIKSALCFVSPSGCGVKSVAIIPDEWKEWQFRDVFSEARKYYLFEYGIEIDKSGSDICRACYLPWDAMCFVNQQFLTLNY